MSVGLTPQGRAHNPGGRAIDDNECSPGSREEAGLGGGAAIDKDLDVMRAGSVPRWSAQECIDGRKKVTPNVNLVCDPRGGHPWLLYLGQKLGDPVQGKPDGLAPLLRRVRRLMRRRVRR